MYNRRVVLLGLVFVLFFSIALPIQAGARSSGNIAILQEVEGDVTFVKGGGKRSFVAYDGVALQQGDSVRTGKDSSVHIVLENEDEIVLGAESHILISELAESNTSIKLSSGGLWNKIKRFFGASDTYEIETPTAVMGVRGTMFHVNVDADDARLRVFDGLVGVNDPRRTDEREVGIFEQLRTGMEEGTSQEELLNIHEYLEVADQRIIMQTILDLIEATELRSEGALEHIRSHQQTGIDEALMEAIIEAQNALILAELTRAITQEVERSPHYGGIQQRLDERRQDWQLLRQQNHAALRAAKEMMRQIEALADEAEISEADRESIQKPLNDKIDQIIGSHPPPSTGGSTPSPGPGPEPDPEPSTAVEVTATFVDGDAEVFGSFAGIDYGLLIPRLPGDGDTITFTIDHPESHMIATGAGPVHALSITGLEERGVHIALSPPDGLDGDVSGYHYEGNGRWEPRASVEVEFGDVRMIAFETTLSAVAVAAEVPKPHLFSLEHDGEGVKLGWESMEGITYELLKDGVVIFTSDDHEVATYTDVDFNAGQTYTMRAVRAGFESMLSNEMVEVGNDMPFVWLDVNGDATELMLHVSGFPDDRPIVAVQVHLGIESESYIGYFEDLASNMSMTSTLFGESAPGQSAHTLKGVQRVDTYENELIVAELLFGESLESGLVLTGGQLIAIDVSILWNDHLGPFDVRILDAMFIDVDGDAIEVNSDHSVIQLDRFKQIGHIIQHGFN